jgi:hypothetical protein
MEPHKVAAQNEQYACEIGVDIDANFRQNFAAN